MSPFLVIDCHFLFFLLFVKLLDPQETKPDRHRSTSSLLSLPPFSLIPPLPCFLYPLSLSFHLFPAFFTPFLFHSTSSLLSLPPFSLIPPLPCFLYPLSLSFHLFPAFFTPFLSHSTSSLLSLPPFSFIPHLPFFLYPLSLSLSFHLFHSFFTPFLFLSHSISSLPSLPPFSFSFSLIPPPPFFLHPPSFSLIQSLPFFLYPLSLPLSFHLFISVFGFFILPFSVIHFTELAQRSMNFSKSQFTSSKISFRKCESLGLF